MERIGRCLISKTVNVINSSYAFNQKLCSTALASRLHIYPSPLTYLSCVGRRHSFGLLNNFNRQNAIGCQVASCNVLFLQQQRSIRKYLPSSNYYSTIKAKLKVGNILRRRYSDEKLKATSGKVESTPAKSSPTTTDPSREDQSKMSLYQKFKFLWKKYWYILIPVHFATSCFWFGSLYYMSYCGVDLIGFLEGVGFSEKIIGILKQYPAGGHFVIAAAIYKLILPLRYMTTIGITHYAMKFLSRKGWIKPAPGPSEIIRRTSNFRRVMEEKRKIRKKQKLHKNGHSHEPKDHHKNGH